MAGYAKALRELATNSGLQEVYDNLCDVLDALNEELRDEDDGMITHDWRKFSTSGNVHLSKSISD